MATTKKTKRAKSKKTKASKAKRTTKGKAKHDGLILVQARIPRRAARSIDSKAKGAKISRAAWLTKLLSAYK